MIDIEKAKKEFVDHVNKIQINNPKVQIKVAHTFRVIENCKKIATSLNLKEEEINLAELIRIIT